MILSSIEQEVFESFRTGSLLTLKVKNLQRYHIGYKLLITLPYEFDGCDKKNCFSYS